MTALLDFIGSAANTPLLLLLAGPNGAGKSTFYARFLSGHGLTFINADEIAKALRSTRTGSTLDVDKLAFDKAEEQRRLTMEARQTFITETVFSDPHGAKLNFLQEARDVYGYSTTLVFIGIEHELSLPRVMQRVEQGGHDVPDEKLETRYPRTMANLKRAVPLVDTAFIFDNGSIDEPYRLVARYDGGHLMERGYIPSWAQDLLGLTP